MNLLLSFGVILLLIVEGRLLMHLLARGNLTSLEEWSLGFPLGAFVNALLFFAFTVTGIPLTPIFVVGGHALIAIALFGLPRILPALRGASTSPFAFAQGSTQHDVGNFQFPPLLKKIIIAIIALSLGIKGVYGFTHAILLPTYYYDSLSQWNMRSRISFGERKIAFDETQVRGISKPQYPILLHSLQIAVMLPQNAWLAGSLDTARDKLHLGEGWQDRLANAATFLLTCSSFLAFFLLLRRFTGNLFSLLTLGALFSIPLLSIHLVQGYGDLHVIEYLLLSALFLFFAFKVSKEVSPHASSGLSMTPAFLMLSGLFAAAASWVKLEGFFFVLLPWVTLVAGLLFSALPRERLRQEWIALLPGIFLGSLWIFFLLASGSSIGPHSDDLSLGWHSQGIPLIVNALFLSGSFGIAWYALPLLLTFLLPGVLREWKMHRASLAILLWGAVTFFGTLAIYLLTPNIEFLLNNQTFHRTMLMPVVLFIVGTALLLHEKKEMT
jgi:hypothetical protein